MAGEDELFEMKLNLHPNEASGLLSFREAEVGHVTEDPAMELEVSRRSFTLHRIINDGLQEVGPDPTRRAVL